MFIVPGVREQMWFSGSLCAEAIGTGSIMCRVCNFTGRTLGWEKRPWGDKWFISHVNCGDGERESDVEEEKK